MKRGGQAHGGWRLRAAAPEEMSTVLRHPTPPVHERYNVGAALNGHWQIEEVRGGTGASGMGVVFIVNDGVQRCAAKTFQRRYSQELPFIQRFIREAHTWMLLGFHPNIVHALQLDIIDGRPFLFMEYVPPDAQGRYSLADYLNRGPLPLKLALLFALQLADGMCHAVAAAPGLVHRDLKPENLLVTPEGILKITDFGLVRGDDAEEDSLAALAGNQAAGDLTQVGSAFGTPAYMAPEQFEDANAVMTHADIYSFGCCIYEACCGSPPFRVRARDSFERMQLLKRKHQQTPPEPLCSRVEDIPDALDAVVMKCLEKEPADRWQDFQELRTALLAAAAAVLPSPYEGIEAPPPDSRRVAMQVRSLSLLDGYERAIQLRNLRETHEDSPYYFHLALAAYFHVQGEVYEERRQLEKAVRARTIDAASPAGQEAISGYEAARRLAEWHLTRGDPAEARLLLDDFLADHPAGLDRVLEPWVRLKIHQDRLDEAEQGLARLPQSIRTRMLLLEVLEKREDWARLHALLDRLLDETLAQLGKMVEGLKVADVAAWDCPGDAERLMLALKVLRPGTDTALLATVEGVFWPDIAGWPDFAPAMARLSHLLGILSGLAALPEAQRRRYHDLASLLGYPGRYPRHCERDEYWLWLQAEETPQPCIESAD